MVEEPWSVDKALSEADDSDNYLVDPDWNVAMEEEINSSDDDELQENETVDHVPVESR